MLCKLFDSDQTHDLVWAEKIDSRIINLIANKLGNHSPFVSGLLPITLLDRFVPHNLPWAENWSTVFYEFLKPLSRTHILTNGELNGEAYGFDPEYKADLPGSLNLPDFPEEITLKVTKNQTVSISWLERSHSEVTHGQLCEKILQPVSIWSRRGEIYSAPEKEDLEIKFDSKLWLINSCLIQGQGELKGVSHSQKQLILYQHLKNTLDNIQGQLNISECKILTEFNIKNKYIISIDSEDISKIAEIQLDNSLQLTDWTKFDSPTFTKVPDYYFFAAFIKEGVSIGKPISVFAEENLGIKNKDGDEGRFYVKIWDFGNFPDTVLNAEINRQEVKTKTEEAFGDWDVVTQNCLPSFHDFEPIDSRIRYFEKPIKFDEIGQTKTVDFVPFLFNGGAYIWEISDTRGKKGQVVPGDWTSDKGWSTLTLVSGDLEFFNFFATSLPKRLKKFDYLWSIRYQFSVFVDYIAGGFRNQFAVHNFYPPQLIKSSENIVFITLAKGYRGRPASPQRVNYFPVDLKFLVTNNLSENGIELNYETEQNYPTPTTYYESGTHYRSFRFKINFWDSPPTTQYSPITENNLNALNPPPKPDNNNNQQIIKETIPEKETISLKAGRKIIDFDFYPPYFISDIDNGINWDYVKPEKDKLITELKGGISKGYLFTKNAILKLPQNPPEGSKIGVAIATDNAITVVVDGLSITQKYIKIIFTFKDYAWTQKEDLYLMVDSIRVKEIHERLKLLSDWMGIAQQPDGTIKEFPDPYHVDNLSHKAVKGLKFASFQKAQKSDPHAAMIYEVQTNRVETDKFGKSKIKQGGFVKIFNFSQFLEQFFWDVGKGLGLQESGGIQIPKGDGSGVATFQSQLEVNMETLFLLSKLSKTINGIDVNVSQGMLMQESILYALGVPTTLQLIPWEINGRTCYVQVPVVHPNAPSIIDEIYGLKMNVGFMVASHLSLKEVN